jgi:hypothetical protein
MEDKKKLSKKESGRPRSSGKTSKSRELYKIRSTCHSCGITFTSPRRLRRHMNGSADKNRHVMWDKLGPIRVYQGRPVKMSIMEMEVSKNLTFERPVKLKASQKRQQKYQH